MSRSPSAYLNNPPEERARYKYDVDKDMTLLKFVDVEWGPVGSFNWFATHGTSMGRTNALISSENKGIVARFMEDWYEQKSVNSPFYRGFCVFLKLFYMQRLGLLLRRNRGSWRGLWRMRTPELEFILQA